MFEKKGELCGIDKIVLESYKTLVEALASFLGEAYELILHNLLDLDNSIVKIENGFHSGRKIGSPINDFALSVLEKMQKGDVRDCITYMSTSKYGKPVKSTTMLIRGAEGCPIAMLCINLYLDSPLSTVLNSFTVGGQIEFVNESFINNSRELIKRALEKLKPAVMTDTCVPPSLKNKEIISLLYHQGVFKLKDAVSHIADDLGISKNTVYLHIRSLEENSHSKFRKSS